MNFHQIFIEIATSTFFNGSLYVRGQRFLRSIWVNWLDPFRSNLVQRDCIGGATCMPVHILFSLKSGDSGHFCCVTPHSQA